METSIIVSLAVAASLLALAALIGRAVVPIGARHAFKTGSSRLLRATSLASQMLSWAVILCALEWIIVIVSALRLLSEPMLNFLASGILIVVPVTLAITRGQNFWNDHWTLVHEALGVAASEATEAQRQTWNEQHEFLLQGAASTREAILAKILKRTGPTRIAMVPDGESPTHENPGVVTGPSAVKPGIERPANAAPTPEPAVIGPNKKSTEAETPKGSA